MSEIEKLEFHYEKATPKEMIDNRAALESMIFQKIDQMQDKINEIIDHLPQEKEDKLNKEDFCWGHSERTGKGWYTNGICNDCGKPSYKNIPKYLSEQPTKEVPGEK